MKLVLNIIMSCEDSPKYICAQNAIFSYKVSK